MTINAARQQLVDFSIPYFKVAQVAIVKAESKIKNRDDLTTARLGSQRGTTCYELAQTLNAAAAMAYYDFGTAYQALIDDKIDSVIIDDTSAKEFVKTNSQYRILPVELAVEEYGFCVKKGNTELLTRINQTIKRLLDDGKIAEFYRQQTSNQ